MKNKIKKKERIINKSKTKKNYSTLINNVGQLLEQGRKQTYRAVNNIMVQTYWNIGRMVVEYEQGGKERAEYGTYLLKKLSEDLTDRHGKGFSRDNLENMRRFYLMYSISETVSRKSPHSLTFSCRCLKSATLWRKLSWSHICVIMRIKDEIIRNFYIKEVENQGWSIRELDRQINSMLFERLALSKDKKGVLTLSKKGQLIEKSEDIIKDPYILEFLSLDESRKYTETELEQKIIDNLQKFLLELGKGFMFVSRQQRITLENEHFYIDLVFYNRLLRCFVILELKIGKFTHQDLGQLQMYVNYYDRDIKKKNENPTIGILLCADKKEALVKYTLPENNKQIFASKYKLYLPNKKEIQKRLQQIID
ncbi:DUF1016 domain-containing protein [Candidatus Woesearchaeota archaeon]|nr:DUF1016 domain-containing protein [Candidatus Woesearchaeota archaeon]